MRKRGERRVCDSTGMEDHAIWSMCVCVEECGDFSSRKNEKEWKKNGKRVEKSSFQPLSSPRPPRPVLLLPPFFTTTFSPF